MDRHFAATALLKRNSNMLSAVVDGEVVLVSIDRGNYYALDTVASDIWQRLERNLCQVQLVDELAARYQGSRPHIEADVYSLLRAFVREGLIEAEPSL